MMMMEAVGRLAIGAIQPHRSWIVNAHAAADARSGEIPVHEWWTSTDFLGIGKNLRG
jgi:hypothetical protein